MEHCPLNSNNPAYCLEQPVDCNNCDCCPDLTVEESGCPNFCELEENNLNCSACPLNDQCHKDCLTCTNEDCSLVCTDYCATNPVDCLHCPGGDTCHDCETLDDCSLCGAKETCYPGSDAFCELPTNLENIICYKNLFDECMLCETDCADTCTVYCAANPADCAHCPLNEGCP